MERTTQPSPTDRSSRRTLAERGATLVEYALVFALVAVASLGAIEFLQAQSEREINNQADCVSDRPPPSGCDFAPVPSDVVFPDPAYTPPPVPQPPPASIPRATLGALTQDTTVGWVLRGPVHVQTQGLGEPTPPPTPNANVLIRATVLMYFADGTPVLGTFGTECTTNASGDCTLEFSVPDENVEEVTIRVIGVDSNPTGQIEGTDVWLEVPRP